MTKKTKLLLGGVFVVMIFFITTFLKNWGTAVSENLLEKYKPEVKALKEKPELAKAKCPGIQAKLKKHIPELAKSKDKIQVPTAYKLIADCAYASDDYPEAVVYYRKLAEFEPNTAVWHAKLAETYLKLAQSGEPDAVGDALAPSTLATQLSPEDFRIRRLQARVLAALGLRNRAINAYAEAIRIAPYKMIAETKRELQDFLAKSNDESSLEDAVAVGK
ncbi:MAG: hypothetical protein E6Q51_02635 [Methylophilus methylotrophus]|uniref:Uncharacterized protein n=1 Tax=Methylophilus methylotrophus TaxID=17 RepID=A0A5C7WI61_METME|nr:MAG: hypothetical protein E6Q51_02635 [Methylophilus methylotrophus]